MGRVLLYCVVGLALPIACAKLIWRVASTLAEAFDDRLVEQSRHVLTENHNTGIVIDSIAGRETLEEKIVKLSGAIRTIADPRTQRLN